MGDRQQANLRDWAAGLSVSHSCANPRRAGWIGALPVPRRLAPLSAFGFPGQLVAGGDPDGRRTIYYHSASSTPILHSLYPPQPQSIRVGRRFTRAPDRLRAYRTRQLQRPMRCECSVCAIALCGRLRVQETKKIVDLGLVGPSMVRR